MTTDTRTTLKIFYEKLNQVISPFSNATYVEERILLQSEDEKEIFEGLMVEFNDFIGNIRGAEESEGLFKDYTDLKRLIDSVAELDSEFFGNFKYYEDLFFLIYKKLVEIEDVEFFEQPCSLNFTLMPIDIEDNKFLYTTRDVNDTILLVSLENTEEMEQVFPQLNIELLFYLLDSLDFDIEPPSNKYCLVKDGLSVDEDRLKAFIKLQKVSRKEQIHKKFEYSRDVSITSDVIWDVTKEYHQFNDIIYILSDYNYQSNMLDKYLKIYQVIENFMYRTTICELVNVASPNMFSIRQFQHLFRNVSEKESDALKKFLKKVLDKNYNSTITFKQYLKDKWTNFRTANSTLDFDKELGEIGVIRINSINDSNFHTFLAQLIYGFRNSIVHNKETEFHISYGNLEQYPVLSLILEEFLLSSLEEVIYNLVINDNKIVWYDVSHLTLYRT
ncbi:hypothetical protein bcgnr5390_45250 [Bacillus luti]|uniref:hypothetical protein n=1 Tax=Bacillus cereus group TaxID=86661 RepID=UPI000A3014C3|nr:hypothetical protein [Bacillus paranthracis]SMD90811.1 hypothetical protein BACERE00193_02175 [Bacillus paranthracis]